MKINIVINSPILIRFVSNLCCSVYIVFDNFNAYFPSELISFSCRSMVRKFNMVSEPFLGYQQVLSDLHCTPEATEFPHKSWNHIIAPSGFCPEKSIHVWRTLRKGTCQGGKAWMPYDCELHWFCSVICRYLCSFLRNWMINIQKDGFFSSHTPNPYTLQLH